MSKKRREKNLIFENIQIISAGAKGKSIGKTNDGKTILVEKAVPGDVVDVKVTKKKSKYYEGKIEKIISFSHQRVEPKCSHFGLCGGCKWQNMSYDLQLKSKQNEIINNLQRIGKIELPKEEDILACEKIYRYRNKLEFSFSSKRWLTEQELACEQIIENRQALGFHIPGGWDKILDIEHCFLGSEISNKIRLFIKHYAIKHNLEFFSPRDKDGFLRTMMLKENSKGDIMLLLQFFKEDKEKREALLTAIKEEFPQIVSLLFAINEKANDSIYDLDIQTFFGESFIEEQMEALKFKIGAKSFYQTNSEQAYNLYKVVREYADLKGTEIVYDLYCGTGTISQFVSSKAKKVIGIESVEQAIEAAKQNAKINNIKNCEYLVGDMKDVFNDNFIETYSRADVVITDPPRDGMHPKVVEQLLKLAPEKIVYVSCNSATQARDLNLMKDFYKVEKLKGVDMFPQTDHIESVVLLKRISKH